MEEEKKPVLYVPRKCSYTNRLITAKDHASVQINVAHVDEEGYMTDSFTPFVLCGFIRKKGASDAAFNCLCQEAGLIRDVAGFTMEG
eukprot:TRINITY_DN82213_c0_g1_i1.p1 TRINITY_DN82213_c0_g1~~TRINITY_DN82213_c0_g1_i1.p1  ORF type:complete len:97 (-),score=30.20 TRINITY_DN82213_c0_g1_i1:106-366(-)